MPPRRSKTTPKSGVSVPPPSAPVRRVVKRREVKETPASPDIVESVPVDEDDLFGSREGSGGTLDWNTLDYVDHDTDSKVKVHFDHVAKEAPGAAEAAVARTSRGKPMPQKTVKTAGARKAAVRPAKRVVEVAIPNRRSRRAPIEEDSEEVEVVEEPANVIESDSDGPEDADTAAAAAAFEEGAVDFQDEFTETEDEVDANGNLRGFIDDEAEESDGEGQDDAMHVDGDEAELADDEMQVTSPGPVQASGKIRRKIKRTQADLSDVEDAPITRKRREVAPQDTTKAITATGYNGETTTLTFRNKEAAKVNVATAAPVPRATVAPKRSRPVAVEKKTVEVDQKDTEDMPMNKTTKGVNPEDTGCEVTHVDNQTGPLLGTYYGCPPLKHSKFVLQGEPAGATLTVLFNGEQFHDDISLPRIREMFKLSCVPTARLFNPARVNPSMLRLSQTNAGFVYSPANSTTPGEAADLVWLGYVTESNVAESRSYPVGEGTRVRRDLTIVLFTQEWQRGLSCMSMTAGGKPFGVPVTEDGGFTFSTKHTLVGEDGSGARRRTGLGRNFIQQPTGAANARGAVHEDIQRRPREGTESVPVFNCSAHFRGDPEQLRRQRFDPADLLTQRGRVDPPWTTEIPEGSLVAVHSTVTVYTPKVTKVKQLSFNLCAVQILAIPKFG